MGNALIFLFPFTLDVVTGLALFVGRHSLAVQGYAEAVVGSIPLCFGIGYTIASLVMSKLVRPHIARQQMLAAIILVFVLCLALSLVSNIHFIQVLFCLLSFGASMFFNAFQSFMLGVNTRDAKPLAQTVGRYIFSWSSGFALGPFITAVCSAWLQWRQMYFLAAAAVLVLGVVAVRFRPRYAPAAHREEPLPDVRPEQPSLVVPAWIGLLLASILWNALFTWWPVQATELGFSAGAKGLVEFACGAALALSSLALVYLPGWQYRPGWLLIFGTLGIGGLLVFGISDRVLLFAAGTFCYGLFFSSVWSLVVYHAMREPAKAVRRVAVNETCVGICFIVGPLVAALLKTNTMTFHAVYPLAAVMLAGGIVIQYGMARYVSGHHHKNNPIP